MPLFLFTNIVFNEMSYLGVDLNQLTNGADNPLGITTGVESGLAAQIVQQVLMSPSAGVPVIHWIAEHVNVASFNGRGQPDYLAPDAGLYQTGIRYTADPRNPLRGVLCRAPKVPNQDKGGIFYQAQMDLYLPVDPGAIFVLHEKLPKRQDRFDISGLILYATGPAMPCQQGEQIAAWKISLSLERYPVGA